jgi:hypothetical protein
MRKFAFLFAGLVGSMAAGSAMASDFSVDFLHKSSVAATEAFKKDYGQAFHNAIYSIEVSKGNESAKVKILYRQANAAQVIEYFCHYHDADEIDCHEH